MFSFFPICAFCATYRKCVELLLSISKCVPPADQMNKLIITTFTKQLHLLRGFSCSPLDYCFDSYINEVRCRPSQGHYCCGETPWPKQGPALATSGTQLLCADSQETLPRFHLSDGSLLSSQLIPQPQWTSSHYPSKA